MSLFFCPIAQSWSFTSQTVRRNFVAVRPGLGPADVLRGINVLEIVRGNDMPNTRSDSGEIGPLQFVGRGL